MENPKKRLAREAMEGALFRLLQVKPLEKVTVSELCQTAGVNRSTFYAHYLDIYDMHQQLSNQFVLRMFREMIQGFGEPELGAVSDSAHPLILRAIQTSLENRELCRLLVQQKSTIPSVLIEDVLSWCQKRYETFSDHRNADYARQYTMMIGGTIILWYDWIRSDFAAPAEEIARSITRFIEGNILLIWR